MTFRRAATAALFEPVPNETIFLSGRKTPETACALSWSQQRTGGVMDFVAAFLALVSLGVFAAHTLDALRT
jgi:hypothetical protein